MIRMRHLHFSSNLSRKPYNTDRQIESVHFTWNCCIAFRHVLSGKYTAIEGHANRGHVDRPINIVDWIRPNILLAKRQIYSLGATCGKSSPSEKDSDLRCVLVVSFSHSLAFNSLRRDFTRFENSRLSE